MTSLGVCSEWTAEALIPDAVWYGHGLERAPAPRLLHVGGHQVEAPDSAGGLVRLMALVMVDRTAGDGACTEAHLGAAGFTAPEIALYADRARAQARERIAARDGQAHGPAHRVAGLRPLRPVFRVRAGRAEAAA